jgi:hypothetical protein
MTFTTFLKMFTQGAIPFHPGDYVGDAVQVEFGRLRKIRKDLISAKSKPRKAF